MRFLAALLSCVALCPPLPAGTLVQGKQLDATLSADATQVRPGQRVSLILDIQLHPGMHVYAPGVEGYIPIEWKMEGSAVNMPKPKILFLPAIDERVPVYEGEFRLTRDVTIPPAHSSEFVLQGTLRYQACDDRLCYLPQELPLKWVFEYREK